MCTKTKRNGNYLFDAAEIAPNRVIPTTEKSYPSETPQILFKYHSRIPYVRLFDAVKFRILHTNHVYLIDNMYVDYVQCVCVVCHARCSIAIYDSFIYTLYSIDSEGVMHFY